jgi:hypothetical protein
MEIKQTEMISIDTMNTSNVLAMMYSLPKRPEIFGQRITKSIVVATACWSVWFRFFYPSNYLFQFE